jgi:hypothetical protein
MTMIMETGLGEPSIGFNGGCHYDNSRCDSLDIFLLNGMEWNNVFCNLYLFVSQLCIYL